MDAKAFHEYVRMFFKDFLPSSRDLRIRPENGFISISFSDDYDFVVSVLAATGANIEVTITGLFGVERAGGRGIDSCALRFDLIGNCLDPRLVHFMCEVIFMRARDGNMTQEQADKLKVELHLIEQWIDSVSS